MSLVILPNNAIDPETRVPSRIDYVRFFAHEAKVFYLADNVTLASGAMRDILTITPNSTKITHLAPQFVSLFQITVELYEDTVTSADGTSITAFNRHFGIATAPDTTFFHTPTVTAVGNIKVSVTLGSTTAGARVGADFGVEPFILKANTKYLNRIISGSNNNNLQTVYDFYENDPTAL